MRSGFHGARRRKARRMSLSRSPMVDDRSRVTEKAFREMMGHSQPPDAFLLLRDGKTGAFRIDLLLEAAVHLNFFRVVREFAGRPGPERAGPSSVRHRQGRVPSGASQKTVVRYAGAGTGPCSTPRVYALVIQIRRPCVPFFDRLLNSFRVQGAPQRTGTIGGDRASRVD